MFYPKLKDVSVKRYRTNSFGGLVHSDFVPESSFYDMENLTSDRFPLLRVREARGKWTGINIMHDILTDSFSFPGRGITAVTKSGERLCCCSDTEVFIDGRKIEGAELSTASAYRSIVPFGRNFFIAPDGLYIKIKEDGYEIIDCNYSVRQDEIQTYFCSDIGTKVSVNYIDELPQDASEGEHAIIHQGNSNLYYEYSGSEWVYKEEVYARIFGSNSFEGFFPGDVVNISSNGLLFNYSEYTVREAYDTSLILEGTLIKEGSTKVVFVKKKFPAMDYVIEFNNRLWGCRYGVNSDGVFVNEIYASELGDPSKWYSFDGISTDSYCASIGCSGEFTGVAQLGSELLFFKEEFIIRVTGSAPSDFSVYAFPARGVEKGAKMSIVNLNEKLFYKSRNGITVYDGTMPFIISEALGNGKYRDPVAGSCNGKYYIAMTDASSCRSIFVYDTKTGLWHKEDDTYPTRFMTEVDGCLILVKHMSSETVDSTEYKRYSFFVHDVTKSADVHNIFRDDKNFSKYEYLPEELTWFAETGKLGENENPERQILRSLTLNLKLEEGASFSLYIFPDSGDEWKKICYFDTPTGSVVSVPVNTPPCHSFRLRFEGKGGFTLYSLTRTCEISGEVKVYGR